MLKPIAWNTLSADAQKSLLQRPRGSLSQEERAEVARLITKVQTEGDKAVFAFTETFDNVAVQRSAVTQEEWDAAISQVTPAVVRAFEQVIAQLTAFHQRQTIADYAVETAPGIVCERIAVPIQRVGLYVPGGSAPLVSTVMMLGVPSRIAGCPLRILCTPPNRAGSVDPHILVAARLCGIAQVFKVGGAQAIAAMAYGTASIPKVDKIFGPGNRWVTLAKMLVALDPDGAALDMPAGPSELMVLADETANPDFVAADLLSQAEHGTDSQVILVCKQESFAAAVNQALRQQIQIVSRASIAKQSLSLSRCILVENLEEAIRIANAYAPEHLSLQITNPRDYLPQISTAGSVFLGSYSPETAGDYASGTNHVLPTAGFARAYSGLSLCDFMRTMSVQELTQAGLATIAATIRSCTAMEGLDAHQQAVDIRLSRRRGA